MFMRREGRLRARSKGRGETSHIPGSRDADHPCGASRYTICSVDIVPVSSDENCSDYGWLTGSVPPCVLPAQIDYAVTGLQERLAEFRFKIDLSGDHVEVIDSVRAMHTPAFPVEGI
jgi:hypothetical protein